MRKYILFTIISIILSITAYGQRTIVEGYTFETNNRGFLREVKITVYSGSNAIKAEAVTNSEGFFSVELDPGFDYKIKASKSIFEDTFHTLSADKMIAGEKVYAKIEIQRKPGYLFDVMLSESSFNEEGYRDGIEGAKIEIYNNTTNEEVLVLENNTSPNFTYTFEQGNYYTVMIRKDGYFTKRMEAHVNIDGCILCFEGMGNVRPSDNLTEGNTMGTLIANVQLDKIKLKEGIKIENIYYDFNKSDIRSDAALELDKIIILLKDNPNLIIELGSHTDARGKDQYNLNLSEKRAKSAVAYIMKQGNIPTNRIQARGYGESQIANRCSNNVNCSDEEHEQNRRTMIKVVGFTEENPYNDMSLRDIIYNENLDKAGSMGFESFQYVEGEDLPDEIKRDIDQQIDVHIKEPELNKHEEAPTPSSVLHEPSGTNSNSPTPTPTTSIVNSSTEHSIVSPSTTLINNTSIDKNISKTIPTKAIPSASTNLNNTSKKENKLIPVPSRLKKEPTNSQNKPSSPPSTGTSIAPQNVAGLKQTNTSSSSNANTTSNNKVGIFGESVEDPMNKIPLAKANIVPQRNAKLLAENFSGYMVEFFNSNVELSSSHSIFKQYGQIKMEKKESGEYAYLIGEFSSYEEAEEHINNILKHRFPTAQVITYDNGKRVVAEE